MFDDFLINALLAGFGIAIIAGIIGCFVVWRRMAYFGDSLAHSALLGVAFGFATGQNINTGVILVCLSFACLLLWLQQKRILATDTLLGILAHSALSLGIVTISLLEQRINLHGFLFGDILAVTDNELWWIFLGGALILILLKFNWQSLVLMTIDEDLAKAENVQTFLMNILLMLLMTIVVAVSIKVVGILLITSMLIIPAAAARQLANSPEKMAIISALIGVIAVLLGIFGSIEFDTPTGPSVVTALAFIFGLLFVLGNAVAKLRH